MKTRIPRVLGSGLSQRDNKASQSLSFSSTFTQSAQTAVSRPSTLRTLGDANAARSLFSFDLRVWVAAPAGQPMPQPAEYGLNLKAPSSDEVLAMAGGRS